jgi:hypothetical protein
LTSFWGIKQLAGINLMTTKVFTIPSNEIDQLEAKLNQLLAKPEFQGYEVAASFPNDDFTEVVFILQKP